MTEDEALAEFRDAGGLLEGHFVLTSGLHSPVYFNKSAVGTDPARVERLCAALAAKARAACAPAPAFVISPVVGAIVFGYETARQLGLPFMFLDRGPGDDGFVLKRGFTLPQDAPVLVVEDIVSTGLSARDAVSAVRAAGARPVGLACLIDRSGGAADVGAPLIPLASLSAPAYPADALPPELAALPAVKPGSREPAA